VRFAEVAEARLQVRHDDHSLSGIAYFTANVRLPPRPGQGH
jgi:hypothetical protein